MINYKHNRRFDVIMGTDPGLSKESLTREAWENLEIGIEKGYRKCDISMYVISIRDISSIAISLVEFEQNFNVARNIVVGRQFRRLSVL